MACFTHCNSFKVHPCCSMFQNIFPFYGHLDCFCLLTLMNSPAINIGVHTLFESLLSIHVGKCLGVELLDYMVILFLVISGTATLFSIAVESLYIPTGNAGGFQFLHIHDNIFPPVFFIIPILINGCKVVSHFGFS